jgi:hypothetical protein
MTLLMSKVDSIRFYSREEKTCCRLNRAWEGFTSNTSEAWKELWKLELFAECANRKNSHPAFFKIPISFVDLVEFPYFRPFDKHDFNHDGHRCVGMRVRSFF